MGYLVPVRLDYTVQVLLTLLIAGTGMYVLARVMRIGVLGATMAATAFELSGAFISVLGWPIAAVISWSGWLFACTILVIRGRHRRRDVTLFALVLALSIYAGEPDTLVVLLTTLVVFFVVMVALRTRQFERSEAIGRPLLDVMVGSVAGLGLAAPLFLPAAQLSAGSVRAAGRHNAFPVSDMLHAIFQTFHGTSLAGSRSFDAHGLGWVSTADYIGVIAVVLALVAVITIRRRPAVIAFAAVVIGTLALVYLAPLVSFLNKLPGVDEIRWVRAIQILGFGVAILAGAGLDALVRAHGNRKVRNWLGAGFGAAALLLVVEWAFGRGHLPRLEAGIRSRSFIWPTIEVAIGLAVFGFLVLMGRRRGDPGIGAQSGTRQARPDRGRGPAGRLDGPARRPGCLVVVVQHHLPGADTGRDGPAEGGRELRLSDSASRPASCPRHSESNPTSTSSTGSTRWIPTTR